MRCSRAVAIVLVVILTACEGDRGPVGPSGPVGPPGEAATELGYIEDTRVVFPRTELTLTNPTGVLLNLVATDGHVGIRFYKDFDFGNEQQTNPWHMGFIEGVEGYQSLAILRDWLFTSALWDEDGRLLVGRLDSHPPANAPAEARFHVRGTVDEMQVMVEAAPGQTADVLQVVSGDEGGGTRTRHFAIDAAGNAIIGSASNPTGIILFDTVDGAGYRLTVTNGEIALAPVEAM